MIHQSFPAGTQRAAAHCDALVKRQAAPQELAHELERFGERLAAALRPVLSASQVRSLGARALPASELPGICGAVAANSIHTFGPGERTCEAESTGRSAAASRSPKRSSS